MSLGDWALVTVGAVAASSAGVLLVRKYVDGQLLRDHHEATDPMMACVGTLFAILLGFMVANAMTRFEEARLNVQEEAGATGDIFRLSRSLPPPTNMMIMTDCVNYFDEVSDQEFKLMEAGNMSDKCWQIYSDLWQHCTKYEPKTQGQSNLHQGLVEAMTKLGECRRARNAQISYRLPAVLWTVVYAGAVAIVLFTFFFGVRNLRLQLFMTSIVTIILVLNIYLLGAFDSPFSGEVKVSAVPFEVNRTLFHKALADEQQRVHK
jgi:ABC-type branched-subunit amino acid transport system permease subunit